MIDTDIAVRIKRSQTRARRLAAAQALQAAGYRARTVRRNGHPVIVYERKAA